MGERYSIDTSQINVGKGVCIASTMRVCVEMFHQYTHANDISLIPDAQHPQITGRSYRDHLQALKPDPAMSSVTAFGNNGVLKPLDRSKKTAIMSILNVTPDSFSDGGLHQDPDLTIPIAQDHIKNGAFIIDIGGYSTRPGAAEVSVEEELSRVIPMIQAITRLRHSNSHLKISIDTFRHEVAEEAIKNGAEIVNDVSAGLGDPKMLSTLARLGCTYIAMHMRGNPQTMTKLNKYQHGIIPGVATELLTRVQAAEAAGIRKWRMVLDPGIGFAKNQSQNLELLRDFDKLRRWPGLEGFAWLIGASRKKFIGNITGVAAAKDRIWGTAAAVAASVQVGADIVRVHDVKQMSQVVRFADALWRNRSDEPG